MTEGRTHDHSMSPVRPRALPRVLWRRRRSTCGSRGDGSSPERGPDALRPFRHRAESDSVRAMPAGTPLYLRTEFAHGVFADLEMLLVQVVDDFLAPMPVIMVENAEAEIGTVDRSPPASERGGGLSPDRCLGDSGNRVSRVPAVRNYEARVSRKPSEPAGRECPLARSLQDYAAKKGVFSAGPR